MFKKTAVTTGQTDRSQAKPERVTQQLPMEAAGEIQKKITFAEEQSRT